MIDLDPLPAPPLPPARLNNDPPHVEFPERWAWVVKNRNRRSKYVGRYIERLKESGIGHVFDVDEIK